MKAKVLLKIIRLEEYVRLVARAVAVRVCPLCGCNLILSHYQWVCPRCKFAHHIVDNIITTIRSNQIGEDQMGIDFGGEKPPLTKA